MTTYHVADICTLDEKTTGKRLVIFQNGDTPPICAAIVVQFLLQIAQVRHILEVHTHVSRQDRLDQQLT